MGSTSSPTAMVDTSQIGRFGTMSLLKRDESDVVVTAFGIDADTLSFGREHQCDVRLYYPDVSPIHCKITFKERKAFLVVLGTHGLFVDGCRVFPSVSTSSPHTIPLSNNSEIEIHGKRFRFTYPPKDLRAQLFSTPTHLKKRALRLSMIQSAEVFSPRPSPNPMDNLRVLQSPLKPYRIRSALATPDSPSFPAARSLFSSAAKERVEDEDDEEEIILVDGDCPRVVEEERDLIILEDVEVLPEPSSPVPAARSTSPTKSNYLHAPPPMLLPPQPPVTPRRSRPTLHKAVLIRSAQRAILRAELQREEEEIDAEEEAEVFGTILGKEDEEEVEEEEEVKEIDNEGTQQNVSAETEEPPQQGTWIGKIWPFRSRSTSPSKTSAKDEEVEAPLHEGDPMEVDIVSDDILKTGQADVVHGDDDDEDVKDEEADGSPAPLRQTPQTPLYPRLNFSSTSSSGTPPVRRLFNTPQPQRQVPSHGQPRFSLGGSSTLANRPRMSLGGEARRIKVEEQPWKVQDLVIPSPPSSPVRRADAKRLDRERTPGSSITEEERRAIQERRRSAVRMPETFFPGGVPGLGPSSPVKSADQSPRKAGRPSLAGGGNQDDKLDTRSLLEKMKETVEGMKAERRASMAASPRKRVSAEQPAADENEREFSLLREPYSSRMSFVALESDDKGDSVVTPPETVIDSNSSSSTGTQEEEEMEMQTSAPMEPVTVNKAEVVVSPLKTRTGRKKAVGKDRFVDTPSLADDEASPFTGERNGDDEESEEEEMPKKKGKVLRGTAKKGTAVETPDDATKASFFFHFDSVC